LTPDSVIVTTGSQQALYLIGDALIDPGDIVIAEAPSYFVYTGALTSLGARIVSVPIDEDGMDVAAVERTLANLAGRGELSRVKFIYCTSYFQNPTGLTLSLERRRRLYEVAKQFSRDHRIVVLEDAAYRELRYDGPALPSVKSFDAENRYTVLSQTFSKPFAPGIKLGYSLMPPDLMAACLHQKGNHDFGSANLTQHVAHEAMSDGTYVEQGQTLRAGYRKKRDLMLAALERHLPKDVAGIHCTHPHGGLYVWVTLPPAFDTSRTGPLFDAAVHAGVLYVPGDYCFQPDDRGEVPKNHLRLSFGQVHPDDIEPGVRKLCGVISTIASGSSHSSAA
jgi:2-aminoadipate transaminase